MTAWAHLPNAAAIDAVLDDVSARPEAWKADWSVELGDAMGAAHSIAPAYVTDAVYDKIAISALANADFHTWAKASRAAEGVTLALITWPSSADMLALTPDALRTIIATCNGDVRHQAVLLLPAVIARNTM